MKKTFFLLNIFSIIFTITNFCLAITFKCKISDLLFNTEEGSKLQYEYLSEVLCASYFILQMVATSFDVVYYLLYVAFEYLLCNETNDRHADNVRTNAMKENKMSNLFVELLFTILIKGLALGFGFFYSIEIVIETRRIIEDLTNPQTQVQLEILNNILGLTTYIKWLNLITMIYVIWIYTVRIGKNWRKRCSKMKKNYNLMKEDKETSTSIGSDPQDGTDRAINSIGSSLVEHEE